MSLQKQGRLLVAVALGALASMVVTVVDAPIANADEACRSRCHSEWPRSWHVVARGACLAKCKAQDAYAYTKEKVTQAKDKIVDTGRKVYEKAKEVKDKIVDTGRKVYEKAKEVKDKIVDTGRKVYDKGKELYQKAKDYANQVKDKVNNIAKGLWNRAKQCVSNGLGGCLKKLAKGAWDAVKQCYSDGWYGCAKRVAAKIANTACQGVGIFWDQAAKCCKKHGAWGCVKKAAGAAKKLFQRGKAALKETVKKGWKALTNVSCAKVVKFAAKYDPLQMALEKVAPLVGKCRVSMAKGFWCAIPNLVQDVGKLVAGSAKAAWQNKGSCGRAALQAGPMAGTAAMMCGAYHYLKPKVQQAVTCIRALVPWGKKVIQAAWRGGGGSGSFNWRKYAPAAVEIGCSIIGGLIMDIVIGVATAGGSTAASVSSWAGKGLSGVMSAFKGLWKMRSLPMSKIHQKIKLINLALAGVKALPGACGALNVPLSVSADGGGSVRSGGGSTTTAPDEIRSRPRPTRPVGGQCKPWQVRRGQRCVTRRRGPKMPRMCTGGRVRGPGGSCVRKRRQPRPSRICRKRGHVRNRQGRCVLKRRQPRPERPLRIPRPGYRPAHLRGELGCVTGSGVTFRNGPGTGVLGYLSRGSTIRVLEAGFRAVGLQWSKISTMGKTGYVASKYLRRGSCR